MLRKILNLHLIRDGIACGYLSDILDEKEFVLLYDANHPTNVDKITLQAYKSRGLS